MRLQKKQLEFNAEYDLSIVGLLIDLNNNLFDSIGKPNETKQILKELQKTIPHAKESHEQLVELIKLI